MERQLVETIKASTEIMFHNFYVALITCNMDYILCDSRFGSIVIILCIPVTSGLLIQ